MRISDWSSDVCSSDLGDPAEHLDPGRNADRHARGREKAGREGRHAGGEHMVRPDAEADEAGGEEGKDDQRSEEHRSELQSLMRISYAVFCLKKKKIHKQINERLNETIRTIQ